MGARNYKKDLIAQQSPLEIAIHRIQPGDGVLIKTWKEATLTPQGEGPYVVLFTAETAIRTAERGWTHASRVKGPIGDEKWEVAPGSDDLKLTLRQAQWVFQVKASPEEHYCC